MPVNPKVKMNMDIGITAIGTANPPYKRSQKESAELVASVLHLPPAKKRFLKSVYKTTGIDYRYSVLEDYCKNLGEFEFFPNDATTDFPSTADRMKIYKENALKLSLAALKNCFENRTIDPKTITHLITVSCTGMYAPGLDIEIAQQLPLSSTVQRTTINFMGCYGAFNAIKLAKSICAAEPATVLIVCVELCTIHFQKELTSDTLISNAIFADGAAAVIVERNPEAEKYLSLNSFYCDLVPQSSQEMAWHIGNSGFDIVLSSYVPHVIQTGIATFVTKLLSQAQISFAEIDFFAIHPGGLKILQACEAALAIQPLQNQYSYDVLKNYGNMSSATILFVLQKLWDARTKDDHGKRIFSCAFGPGLTLESMILTLVDKRSYVD